MFRFIIYSIFSILFSVPAFAAEGLPPTTESASPLDLLALAPKAGLFVLPLAIFAVIYFWPKIKSSKLFNRAAGQGKAEILTTAGQTPVAFAAPVAPEPVLVTAPAPINIPRVSRFESISTHKRAILTAMVVLLVLSATGGSAYYLSQRSVTQQQAVGCDSSHTEGECDCNWGQCKGVKWHCNGTSWYNVFDASCNGSCTPPTCTGTPPPPSGQTCTNDDTCPPPKVCHFGICATSCNGFSEQVCYTHVNCHWEGGVCKDGTALANPRSPSQVCTDEGGTVISGGSCVADLNCQKNGGTCCLKSGIQNCCYGDSSSRKDGACYLGGQQTTVTCSGSTITNNTAAPITLNRFVGIGKCPFSSPSGTKQLGAGQSITASCEQLEAAGYCGVCDDSICAPTSTPTPTPTPPPGVDCQCSDVQLSATTVQVGIPITITGYGWTSADTEILDKIEFKIKKDGVAVNTEEKAASRESTRDSAGKKYYKSNTTFTPTSVGNYSVTIRVHWQNKNQWKE